jgi:hypothetical protein
MGLLSNTSPVQQAVAVLDALLPRCSSAETWLTEWAQGPAGVEHEKLCPAWPCSLK